MALVPVPLLIADTLASAPTRGAILIGFLILLFALAFVALKVGQRKQAAQAARELSAHTGTADGAHRGGDVSVDSDWWAKAALGEDDLDAAPQSWQHAFLGGADDTAPTAPASASEGTTPEGQFVVGGAPRYAQTRDIAAAPVPVVAPVAPVAPVPTAPVAPLAPAPVAPVAPAVPVAPETATQAWPVPAPPVEPVMQDAPVPPAPAAWTDPSPTEPTPVVPAPAAPAWGTTETPAPTTPAPIVPGVTEPVRTDITYIPEPDPAPPVFTPVPAPQAVADEPISLAPTAPATTGASWGAGETGDDEEISTTWWQQAIAEDDRR